MHVRVPLWWKICTRRGLACSHVEDRTYVAGNARAVGYSLSFLTMHIFVILCVGLQHSNITSRAEAWAEVALRALRAVVAGTPQCTVHPAAACSSAGVAADAPGWQNPQRGLERRAWGWDKRVLRESPGNDNAQEVGQAGQAAVRGI